MDKVLTLADVMALHTIVTATITGAKVRWLTESGDVLEGVARSIGHEDSTFLRAGEDVRDGFLRVTVTMDYFLPVRDVMAMVKRGEFALDS